MVKQGDFRLDITELEQNKKAPSSKSKLFIKTTAYTISAILVIFYLLVLFATPNVCIEYKLYYIDDTLSDWPGYGGLDYSFGEEVKLGSAEMNQNSKRRGYGWSKRSAEFCTISENRAAIFFVVHTDKDISVNISVGEKSSENYSVSANGTTVLEGCTEVNTVLTFKIPSSLIQDNGLLEVTFFSNSEAPLGLQVKSMTLQEGA